MVLSDGTIWNIMGSELSLPHQSSRRSSSVAAFIAIFRSSEELIYLQSNRIDLYCKHLLQMDTLYAIREDIYKLWTVSQYI